MEPITLILTALAAGATSALQESAGDAVKSAYGKLKALIQRKLSGRPHAETVLAGNEEDPDVWKEPLKKELVEAAADRDEEIIQAAKELADLVAPQASRSYAMHVVNQGPVNRQINIQHAERVGFDEDGPT